LRVPLAGAALLRVVLVFAAAALARTAGLDDDARPVRVVRPRAALVEAALEVKSNPILIRVVAPGVHLCAVPAPLVCALAICTANGCGTEPNCGCPMICGLRHLMLCAWS
jgi:hypothetical protein